MRLACELLLAGDDKLRTLAIGDFLEWVPGVGPERAKAIMEASFRWCGPTTSLRQIGNLDLETCLRLAATIKRLCHVVEDDAVVAA